MSIKGEQIVNLRNYKVVILNWNEMVVEVI